MRDRLFATKEKARNVDSVEFIEKIPVGTLVVDTSALLASNLQFPFAWTAEGGIYTDLNSTEVNVKNVNGDPEITSTWSINFVQKAAFKKVYY